MEYRNQLIAFSLEIIKSLAAVLVNVNSPLEMMELKVPPLKKGQVLVEVFYSSICQSQINEIRGRKGVDNFLPHTLGHEGSGKVLDIGADVKKVKPGDSVVMTWIKGSGHDIPSVKYKSDGKIINSGAISTFLTHAVISENRLVKISEIPMKVSSLLGCAIPTGAGIVYNDLKAVKGRSISIWGAGGIGLSSLIAAKKIGLNPIIAIDINESKLSMAKELGADYTLLYKNDLSRDIHEITNSIGCDYAIECAGKIKTIETAFNSINKNSGKLVIAGNPKKGKKFSIDPFDLISGKQIFGTWGGSTSPDRDILNYANLYKGGKFPIDKLITHVEPFNSINDAISIVESGKSARVVLQIKETI